MLASDFRHRLLTARLPAMPQVLLRLLALCQDEEAGTADFARLIAQDPALAAKVLGTARSAAYGHCGSSADIGQAVQLLGTDLTRTLAISQTVFQVFNDFPHTDSANLDSFWQHTLRAAILARLLARHLNYPRPEEAYLGGLLHDVGRLALFSVAPAEYGPLFRLADGANLCVAEEAALQINHAETGAWLVERWKLDSFLADAVLYHHEDMAEQDKLHPLVPLVQLAHLLADGEQEAARLEPAAHCCGLLLDALPALVEAARPLLAQLAKELGIPLPAEPGAPAVAHTPATAPQERLATALQEHLLLREAQFAQSRQQEPRELHEAILHAGQLLFQLEAGGLLLFDAQHQQLRGTPIGGQTTRWAEVSLTATGPGPLAEALASGQARLCQPTPGDDSHRVEQQLARLLDSQALLLLPLHTREEIVGMLVAAVPEPQLAHTAARLPFLQAYARLSASNLLQQRQRQAASIQGQAELEARQQLAGRKLAHEINNPLAIIRNYLGALESRLAQGNAPTRIIAALDEEIARVGRIVQDFARGEPPPAATPGPWSLATLLEDCLGLFRDSGTATPAVHFSLEVEDEAPILQVNQDQVRQILINLVKNALEAMPQGGEVRITSLGQVYREGGFFQEIQVCDNGPGMPAETLKQLFAPLATHKGAGHQGLGLSIVHDLVTRLGGHISCRSSKRGTVFHLLLPLPGEPSRS